MHKLRFNILNGLVSGLGYLSSFIATTAMADVKLPSVFSDHMVLQCQTTVPVWGWADPGEKVTVQIAGQTKTVTANADGHWSLKLDKLSADTPVTLTVKGRNTIVIEDVLVGEVWLASGQSNMQLPVNDAMNAGKEKAAADLPQIRMFTVARRPAVTPQSDCEGQWMVCSPETVGRFSATAFFFARDLHQSLKQPIGVIHSSWGATPIETWTSMPWMEGQPEFTPVFKAWEDELRVPYAEEKAQAQYLQALEAWPDIAAQRKAEGKEVPPRPEKQGDPRWHKNYPANLFNGMIAPIIPYAIRGAIWYQGENNAGSDFPRLYALQLSLLIEDWRGRWGQGEFPFGWVQLPNYKTNPKVDASQGWPISRECMLKTLSVTNTGMAITIDVGDPKEIHPRNKQAVGHRLALWARAKVYGENIPYSGPLPAGYKIDGHQIILSFMHTDGGLVARDGELRGFEIAGADRKWFPATARIQGDQVVVFCAEVKVPVAVRYAWASNPDCNLFNGANLSASPFRTVDW